MYTEEVEVTGHIIDSLLLPKILDCISAHGGTFRIKDMSVGQLRADPSRALIEVQADNEELLNQILSQIGDHGAVPTAGQDCRLEPADVAGSFPEGFYCTTHQRTEIRWQGHWLPVNDQEMDCGIVADPDVPSARCVSMNDVELGMQAVIGHTGVRVIPEQGEAVRRHSFEFMSSGVSTEKPKGAAVRQIARELHENKERGGKTLLVGGPAIVHTDSARHVCRLIELGYINTLFAGNALAAHDIEQSFFGTSLGVQLDIGGIAEAGHEHHLRAINRIRRIGGIRPAVEKGILQSGIMYECIRRGVDFALAGSIRDDGPLPDVITDVVEAQRVMRQKIRGINYCLMVATTLHSIAVGNLLPAWVRVVCVDINPSTAIKLNDRGSLQTVGLVTDVEPFLRALIQEVENLRASSNQPSEPIAK